MPDNRSYWKHSNIGIFAYGQDDVAGPVMESDRREQALSDWNRLIIAGEQCTYYINNEKLSTLRSGVTFNDAEELKEFFMEHLFKEQSNAQELAELARLHFHQAGLPHATNFCLKNRRKTDFQCTDPETVINFLPSPTGLSITEDNIYKTVTDNMGKKTSYPNSKAYFARTTTTYLFSEANIYVSDLVIDCPNSLFSCVAEIFDRRTLWEKLCDFIENLIAHLQSSGPSL